MRSCEAEQPQVLSLIPGRLRLHLPGWSGEEREPIEARLRQIQGVQRVEANPLTGNVLILFDPQAITADALLAALGGAPALSPGSRHLRKALRCGVRGLLGHAVVDSLLYTLAFAEPFGLPLAPLAAFHLGIDAVVWTVSLAPLLAGVSDTAPRDGLAAAAPGP